MNWLEKCRDILHSSNFLASKAVVSFKKKQKKLSFKELQDIVAQVTYLDWKLVVELDKAAVLVPDDQRRPYLQVLGHGPDPQNGMEDAEWSSRKFWLSGVMCKNEVIRTALKAIECAVAHEMYENILYKGYAVFTPHMDYDVQVEMMRTQGDGYKNSRIDGMQGT
jgi:hypothetical protein